MQIMEIDLLTATASELSRYLKEGQITSLELVRRYHEQILRYNGLLNAMISITPLSRLEKVASGLDKEREEGKIRGPMHGIPLIIKDALDTTDEFELQSTAGGWAFEDTHPMRTAKVVELATGAGLIIMGKANLSQFGNWKADNMSGGWSARGGQTQSAYVKGGISDDDRSGPFGHSNPSGSSSGSAVSVSAGFAPVSIGADFNGSLTNPAIRAALYTLRVTPGIVSEDGGFPFSVDRDSVGPMAKTTEDLINLLNVILDRTHPEVPEAGFDVTRTRTWKDISIATIDPQRWHLPASLQKQQHGSLEQIVSETLGAYSKLKSLAKSVIGPVDLIDDEVFENVFGDVMKLVVNDFSGLLDEYLKHLKTPKVKSLAELIAFNEANSDLELPPEHPGQEKLVQSQNTSKLSQEEYNQLEKTATDLGIKTIDDVLKNHGVDLILAPADSMVPNLVAMARSPSLTLPLSYLDLNGRPFGLLAFTSRFNEALLLDVAKLWEETFAPRKPPALDSLREKM